MMMDPKQEAVGRLQQQSAPAQAQAPVPAQGQPQPNAGGQPGQPGGKESAPAVVGLKLLNSVASRIGMMGYKAESDKLAQALGQVEAVIEEIKQTVGQQGGQPPAPQGQPGQMRGTPAEGQNRGTPMQGSGVQPS